ncbi:hypothetical protein H5410_004550 [Solanum commersonii]|uniref:Uncharacterized protein n=1 Tax=Solanum commersonii TaxID=4109 RepID=A0A9J6B840_SOLCO|nr:hypothetical protein H5410_004550 [Solanum commersonii]
MSSSQRLAGYQHKHKSQGNWIRGDPHEKFFCPSTELPTLYRQLGTRKLTPIVLRHQGCFYSPHPKNQMFYGTHKLPGRPHVVLYQPLQAMVLQVLRVVAHAPIAPLLIQNQNLFANRPNQLVENTNIG